MRLSFHLPALALGLLGLAACGSNSAVPGFPDATAGGSSSNHNPDAAAKKDSGGMLMQTMSAMCNVASPNQQGCPCTVGQTIACYTGPAATRNVGVCHDGAQRCQASGEFATFGACLGEVLPPSELACYLSGDAGAPPPVDAATPPPPVDAATPPPPVDAATPPPPTDAASGTIAVGQPCTPGQVMQSSATLRCSGALSCGCTPMGCTCECNGSEDAGASMGEVLVCDTSGVWNTFPSGSCNPTTCNTCLQSKCQITDAGAACAANIQKALAWLGACGPDRASYYSMLVEECGAVSLLECKDEKCLGTAGNCSSW